MWNFIITWIATTVLSALLAPRPRDAAPGQIGGQGIPIASQDAPIPVLFGTRVLSQPNVVWWGDVTVSPIRRRSGGIISKKVTVGYWYGLGMHMALCHGPVDAVTEIQIGEKTAWTGSVTGNASIVIANRELFGGEEREGGVDGTLDVMMGAATQGANAYLQSRLGTQIPAFRGVLSVVWRGLVGTQTYIKPWRFRVRRIPSAWYPAKADISGDANPAHIIRECLTNAEWGMGYPEADIDDASFTAAADALHAEGFGLSIIWDRESTIEDFVLEILRSIDGVLYAHPRTGKFTLKLARADYAPASLPLLSPANILSVEEFGRPSLAEIGNQVVLQYRDGTTDRDASITVQDIAAIALQGATVSTTLRHAGISRGDLASRVAQRELRQLSSALAKVTLVANRQASSLDIGSVFRLTWPAYGITEMIMRVARASYGALDDGRVRIEAVQDAFALPAAVYATPPATGWQQPISLPAPCPAQTAYEAPRWAIAQDLAGDMPSLLADIGEEGIVAVLGARPSSDALDYRAWAWDAASSAWADRDRGAFAATALLAAAMPQSIATISVPVASPIDLDRVAVNDLAIIDSEWLRVTAIDTATATVTLARGVLDTVADAHVSGARVWFVSAHYILPRYAAGANAQVRLTPATPRGELAVSAATTLAVTLQRRVIRPYPPANVRLNGQSYPAAVAGDLVVSWSRRNRLDGTLRLQADADVSPETGQTTTIRCYDSGNVLRRTYSGLTGTSQTWTLAQIIADGAGSSNLVRIEVEASRTDAAGTFTSLQKHSITVARAGYGLNYGNYYGGV